MAYLRSIPALEKLQPENDEEKTGIIDPTKVGRLALEKAASVAMMILTTECVIATKKEKERVPFVPMDMEQ